MHSLLTLAITDFWIGDILLRNSIFLPEGKIDIRPRAFDMILIPIAPQGISSAKHISSLFKHIDDPAEINIDKGAPMGAPYNGDCLIFA